jgi:hypothetical protein
MAGTTARTSPKLRLLAVLDDHTTRSVVLATSRSFAPLFRAELESVYVYDTRNGTRELVVAFGRDHVQATPRAGALTDLINTPGIAAAVVAGVAPDGRPVSLAARRALTGARKPIVVLPPGVRPYYEHAVPKLLLALDGAPEPARAVDRFLAQASPGVEPAVLQVSSPFTAPAVIADACRASSSDAVVLAWSQDFSTGHARVVREVLARSEVPVLLLPIAGDASRELDLTEREIDLAEETHEEPRDTPTAHSE